MSDKIQTDPQFYCALCGKDFSKPADPYPFEEDKGPICYSCGRKTQTTARCTFVVDLALRGGFRKQLEKMTWEIEGSKYKEVKGFLYSTFYVQSTPHAIKQLCNLVERINEDD